MRTAKSPVRSRAGLLLAVVLVSAIVLAVAHRLAPTASPVDRTDPSLTHRVDLNRAGSAEIAVLPGIGDVLASRIVESREREGTFPRVEDLSRVHGIGPRTIEKIRTHVLCGPETP